MGFVKDLGVPVSKGINEQAKRDSGCHLDIPGRWNCCPRGTGGRIVQKEFLEPQGNDPHREKDPQKERIPKRKDLSKERIPKRKDPSKERIPKGKDPHVSDLRSQPPPSS